MITFQTRYWQVKLIYLNQLERYFTLNDSYLYQRCRIRKPSQQDGKVVWVLNKFTNKLNYIWCSQHRKKIREVHVYDNFSPSNALKTARWKPNCKRYVATHITFRSYRISFRFENPYFSSIGYLVCWYADFELLLIVVMVIMTKFNMLEKVEDGPSETVLKHHN